MLQSADFPSSSSGGPSLSKGEVKSLVHSLVNKQLEEFSVDILKSGSEALKLFQEEVTQQLQQQINFLKVRVLHNHDEFIKSFDQLNTLCTNISNFAKSIGEVVELQETGTLTKAGDKFKAQLQTFKDGELK